MLLFRQKFSIIILLLTFSLPTLAESGFAFDPSLVFGYTQDQGSYARFGLDLKYKLNDELSTGLHGYYAAGSSRPETNREIGGGWFLGYVQPVAELIFLTLRQEINYVDQVDPKNPRLMPDGTFSYRRESGVISATSLGVHLQIENFGVSAGYRQVVGISRTELGDGRSGMFLGLGIAIF